MKRMTLNLSLALKALVIAGVLTAVRLAINGLPVD